MENEIDTAWNNATSIPPGEHCTGDFIGSRVTEKRVYDFYKENGKYKYISYPKEEKENDA